MRRASAPAARSPASCRHSAGRTACGTAAPRSCPRRPRPPAAIDHRFDLRAADADVPERAVVEPAELGNGLPALTPSRVGAAPGLAAAAILAAIPSKARRPVATAEPGQNCPRKPRTRRSRASRASRRTFRLSCSHLCGEHAAARLKFFAGSTWLISIESCSGWGFTAADYSRKMNNYDYNHL